MKKATTGGPNKNESTRTGKPAGAKRASTAAPKIAAAVAAPATARATTPKISVTSITARIDVGFGNLLFIRGDGPGLSWDRGIPMECVSSDAWTWSTTAASRPFAYKVLINDEQWSAGDDFIASVGVDNTIRPAL